MFRLSLAAAAVFLAVSSAAGAATLTATGATGVDVNGTLYDVTFADGTCAEVFDGCDEADDFTFTTAAGALAAANALLDLINLNPTFDNDPRQVDGCERFLLCAIVTPFFVSDPGVGLSAAVLNFPPVVVDQEDRVILIGFPENLQTEPFRTFAIWTPAEITPIPGPASLPLLAAGLAGLVAVSRRRRTAR